MINLAGNKDADKHIMQELSRCGIPIVYVEKSSGEVPYSVEGKLTLPGLGDFKFDRRWYYWAVECKLPLAIAEELYAIPHFKDIRSGGDCGCRPPATWATTYKSKYLNQIVVSPEETKRVKEGIAKGSALYTSFANNPEHYLCETQEEFDTYPKFVTTYHIDSELGLYVFVETIKKHAK